MCGLGEPSMLTLGKIPKQSRSQEQPRVLVRKVWGKSFYPHNEGINLRSNKETISLTMRGILRKHKKLEYFLQILFFSLLKIPEKYEKRLTNLY